MACLFSPNPLLLIWTPVADIITSRTTRKSALSQVNVSHFDHVCHTWIHHHHHYCHHQYRNKMQVWYLVIACYLLKVSLDVSAQRGDVVCCLFALAEISWGHLKSFFTFLFQRHKPFCHREASPHHNWWQICSSDPLINPKSHGQCVVDLLVFRETDSLSHWTVLDKLKCWTS